MQRLRGGGGYGPPAPPLPSPLCSLKSASGFSQERSPQLWPGLALEFLWEKADQNPNCFRTLPILYAATQWLGHFNCVSNFRKKNINLLSNYYFCWARISVGLYHENLFIQKFKDIRTQVHNNFFSTSDIMEAVRGRFRFYGMNATVPVLLTKRRANLLTVLFDL